MKSSSPLNRPIPLVQPPNSPAGSLHKSPNFYDINRVATVVDGEEVEEEQLIQEVVECGLRPQQDGEDSGEIFLME